MNQWLFLLVFALFGLSGVAQESDSDLQTELNTETVFGTDTLLGLAKSLIGVPYCYGGSSPEGFDCSGFVSYVFAQFGFELPRSTIGLAQVGIEVPMDSCRKGDIILFAGRNKWKRPIGHAGIIVSAIDEPLKFIHSATSNKQGVIITAFDAFDYYKDRFVKVIRVMNPLESELDLE
jgi:cell wall-associated NlpC family hydrolase